jgi:hypothetical protein
LPLRPHPEKGSDRLKNSLYEISNIFNKSPMLTKVYIYFLNIKDVYNKKRGRLLTLLSCIIKCQQLTLQFIFYNWTFKFEIQTIDLLTSILDVLSEIFIIFETFYTRSNDNKINKFS